jgi:hypothetical protein
MAKPAGLAFGVPVARKTAFWAFDLFDYKWRAWFQQLE